MSVHMKADGRVYVSWRENKVQKTKTFGRGPEAEQEAADYDNRKHGKLSVLLDDFESTKRFEGISDGYIATVRMLGEELSKQCSKPIKSIHLNDIIEAMNAYAEKAEAAGRPLSAITKNRYVSYLKVLFNFAKERKYISVNPLETWKKRKEAPRVVKVTLQDLKRIYKAAPEHTKWCIKVMINLGVRPGPSELFALKWEQIDWENNEITVYSPKTQDHRVIPFNEKFAKDLSQAHQKATTPFICSYQGKPITHIRKSWRGAKEKAELGYKCRMYDLRHFFATTMLLNGADLKAVSEMLGHHSTKLTVDTYYHLCRDAKRQACKKLPKSIG